MFSILAHAGKVIALIANVGLPRCKNLARFALFHVIHEFHRFLHRGKAAKVFQTFSLISGRHIGVPRRDTNMASPY